MGSDDNLDLVECVMAIEEALIDRHSASGQRDELIHELKARIAKGEFGGEGDLDDDAFTALVRKLGPRSPRGQAGAAA
jgi:hypothetical protein